ncbi:S-adenosyl-L-methionine-dependent methyltransferase [Sarocladium strictum]
MSILQTLNEAFWMLLDPWLFMSLSARHIPSTIAILISHQAFSTLFSPSGFSEALFGNFWATFGPRVKENAEARVIPLLEGRVSHGMVHEERVNLPVGGVVMEVGAGSGMWADVFKKIDADQGTISKIYGIEPNPQSYTALRQRVKDIGLADVYEVVPVGIEDITDKTAWDGNIEKGSVDCIVGILCLCSIPDQEENIRHLYELLKPGGRWYVYEHVKATRGGLFMRIYQRYVNIFWSFFLGSCRITRPTGEILKNIGPWSKIDLVQPVDQPSPFQVLPHVIGVLTK